MLIHHSGQSYEAAASEAAREARAKMEAIIDGGRASAGRVIDKIMAEVPADTLMRGSAFAQAVRPTTHGVGIIDAEGHVTSIHRHALGQVAERAGLPAAYVTELQGRSEPWAQDLLAHNVRELYARDDKRYLMRSVNGELRGFLSDRFRRIDARPVLDALLGKVQSLGLVPCEGTASDTRVALKAMLPVIFEPVPHEVMCFGLEWSNSDYGMGANMLRIFILRLMCTNKAVANEALRQVHLGRQLDDATLYSERTLQLDTQTSISAMQDILQSAISPAATAKFCNVVKEAHEQKLDVRKAIEALKSRVTKAEREQIVEAYNSPDVEMMPAGNTAWRWSNAISWIAGKTEDADRRLELEREAGKVLPALAA